MKQKVIINGIIHKNFPELDDPLYVGGNIKPSEFERMAEGFKGKPVYVEHGGGRVGTVINSYVSKVNGHLMGDIDIDLDSSDGLATIEKVRRGDLRNLSFGADVMRKRDPKTDIVWESRIGATELSVVNDPAVPESVIKELKVLEPDLDGDGYEVTIREVYNSKQKQENNMTTTSAAPVFHVERPNPSPEDLKNIRMDAPAGTTLRNAIEAQAQQAQAQAGNNVAAYSASQQHIHGIPIMPPGGLSTVPAAVSQPILNMVEEQNKRMRLDEKEREIAAREAEIKRKEELVNAKIKEDEEKARQIQEETRKIQLRTKNAPRVAEIAQYFAPSDENMKKLGEAEYARYTQWKASILDKYALEEETPEIDMQMGTLRASMMQTQSALRARNEEAETHNKIRQAEAAERDRQTAAALERQKQEIAEKEKKIALAASHIPNQAVQKSIFEALGTPVTTSSSSSSASYSMPPPPPSSGTVTYGNITVPREFKMFTHPAVKEELQQITASNLQQSGHAAWTVFPAAGIWAQNNPQGFTNYRSGTGLTASPYYTKGQLEDHERRKAAGVR